MKIGFSGTREGMTPGQKGQVRSILTMLVVSEAHHGDCIGADEDFHLLVREVSITQGFIAPIVIHPPDVKRYRANIVGDESWVEKPYLTRNKDIVECSEFLIATPKGKQRTRSGTWSTVRYAHFMKRPMLIVYPDGTRISRWT